MKISASIASLAIAGRTPAEVDLVDRIGSFVAKEPHAFLGSGVFLALGQRLKAAGVKPVDGEQVDISPYAGSVSVAEARQVMLQREQVVVQTTFERVARVVGEQAQVPAGDISPETVLSKIGFDSLGFVELVLALEERFEISIPDGMKELETVKTVEDIVQVVENVLLNSRPDTKQPDPPLAPDYWCHCPCGKAGHDKRF